MISGVELIDIPLHQDARGSLLALDRDQSLPFGVARVIVLSACPESAVRGEHALSAHVALLALSGRVTVDLNNGREQRTLHLARPDQLLCVHAGVWLRLRNFSPSGIFLEAASKCFREVTYFDGPRPDVLGDVRWDESP
jgi:hypothetical protein